MMMPAQTATSILARDCARKLAQVQWNEHHAGPHRPVRLTAREVNAWLASPWGRRRLPAAVTGVQLTCRPGWVQGQAEVNFSLLPRLAHGTWAILAAALLAGPHHISAAARVISVQAPAARLRLSQVGLDGRQVSSWLLQLILREYVLPRHPQWGQNLQIKLPAGVKSVVMGRDWVRLEYA